MTSKDAIDDLVIKLREANQHLVIATMRAKELQAQAEAANERQKEFLCMLAHELRNPLAPLTTATEILGMITAADPKLPKLHGVMARQVSSLTRLVSDLLDASRVSSGKFALQLKPLYLSEIIESAVETSQPVLDKRGQHLSVELPADPVLLNGDLVRLGQVFSNLLINASKFTHDGGHVAISASRTPGSVTVSVKDDGIGIAPELQPVVFDLFAQGSRSQDGAQGGLGIGLSLVRTIVELHGGAVEVHSDDQSHGTEFKVWLPTLVPPRPAAGATLQENPGMVQARRILIIGDHGGADEALKDFLKRQGYALRSAPDGPVGLLLAKKDAYDVVICDMGLADIDGYDIIRQLRGSLPDSAVCCIALVCDGSKADQDRAVAAGFDHYLLKPVDTGILSKLLLLTTSR
ncbi:MAG: hybrid sensor histidine kinase/response regulator [Noviherbaspirillum sp.]